MSELINGTEKGKVLELLREKFEDSVIYEKPVVISIENSFINCLDGVYVADYEVLDERISLEGGIELSMMLKDSDVSYEAYGTEYCFKIIHKETEIRLYFT